MFTYVCHLFYFYCRQICHLFLFCYGMSQQCHRDTIVFDQSFCQFYKWSQTEAMSLFPTQYATLSVKMSTQSINSLFLLFQYYFYIRWWFYKNRMRMDHKSKVKIALLLNCDRNYSMVISCVHWVYEQCNLYFILQPQTENETQKICTDVLQCTYGSGEDTHSLTRRQSPENTHWTLRMIRRSTTQPNDWNVCKQLNGSACVARMANGRSDFAAASERKWENERMGESARTAVHEHKRAEQLLWYEEAVDFGF